jgi:hypothetical protein
VTAAGMDFLFFYDSGFCGFWMGSGHRPSVKQKIYFFNRFCA